MSGLAATIGAARSCSSRMQRVSDRLSRQAGQNAATAAELYKLMLNPDSGTGGSNGVTSLKAPNIVTNQGGALERH